MASEDVGMFAETVGRVAYAFALIQPYIPTYTHLVIAALFPIVTAAHSSLSRPSSAAEPEKKARDGKTDEDEDNEDVEEETQQMEGLSPSDAIMFPLLAGMTLAGLYFLIKWLEDPAILNKVINWYFALFGIFSVSKLLKDCMEFFQSFVFPSKYVSGGHLWRVGGKEKRAIAVGDQAGSLAVSSPLPGLMSRLPLPRLALQSLWLVRETLRQRWTAKLYIRKIGKGKSQIGLLSLISFAMGLSCVLYFNLVAKQWYMTNLLGFAFSYGALQIMSPTTFATGTLILSALFLYDIYFVFYTPMMVTVAKSLDVPIKLLIPRPSDPQDPAGTRSHAMLGLGDIVLPGMLIGLALRFDLYMFYLCKQTYLQSCGANMNEPPTAIKAKYTSVSNRWGERFWTQPWYGQRRLPEEIAAAQPALTFPKPYFTAALTGYIIGMLTTLGVMHIFEHAQPALLYLVPGVLTATWGTALVRGEIKEMWEFSEAVEEEACQAAATKDKTKPVGEVMHGTATNGAVLAGSKDDGANDEETSSKRSRSNEIFKFTIEAPASTTKNVESTSAPADSTLGSTTALDSKDATLDTKGTPLTKRARRG